MCQQSDQYCSWLTEQADESNILVLFSRNLQKYENIAKSDAQKQLKVNSLSQRKINGRGLHTINLPNHNKQNTKHNQMRQKYSNSIKPKWAGKQKNEQIILPMEGRQAQSKQFKIRMTSRNSRSSNEARQQLVPLKTRELKFEKKDLKKFKDRCVDLYIQNKNKISLRQIDNINKQCKQQKIDLFLRLLRR